VSHFLLSLTFSPFQMNFSTMQSVSPLTEDVVSTFPSSYGWWADDLDLNEVKHVFFFFFFFFFFFLFFVSALFLCCLSARSRFLAFSCLFGSVWMDNLSFGSSLSDVFQ
jgi:hypothetical protein